MTKYEKLRRILLEIQELAAELPAGKRNMISNRCSKISLMVKKMKPKRQSNQIYS